MDYVPPWDHVLWSIEPIGRALTAKTLDMAILFARPRQPWRATKSPTRAVCSLGTILSNSPGGLSQTVRKNANVG
jgi:hypothetical protein